MRVGHKLDDEQKTFVVQRLACFESARRVAALVKDEFSVTVTPQAVECYDPTTRAGRNLAARWRMLFDETRKTYLSDTATVGIAHQKVRLARLDRMAAKAEDMGALALSADLLAQAAKEVGGMFERRGAGGEEDSGGGAPTVNVVIRQLTPPPGEG